MNPERMMRPINGMTESTWTSAVKPWREGRSHNCKHLLANQRPNLTVC